MKIIFTHLLSSSLSLYLNLSFVVTDQSQVLFSNLKMIQENSRKKFNNIVSFISWVNFFTFFEKSSSFIRNFA